MPWPFLSRPLSYSIAQIETEWVSKFYDAVRQREGYSHADILQLIRRCIKVFHEDKLVSRLRDVDGDEDKALVNKVAKVVYLELYSQLQRQRGKDSDDWATTPSYFFMSVTMTRKTSSLNISSTSWPSSFPVTYWWKGRLLFGSITYWMGRLISEMDNRP